MWQRPRRPPTLARHHPKDLRVGFPRPCHLSAAAWVAYIISPMYSISTATKGKCSARPSQRLTLSSTQFVSLLRNCDFKGVKEMSYGCRGSSLLIWVPLCTPMEDWEPKDYLLLLLVLVSITFPLSKLGLLLTPPHQHLCVSVGIDSGLFFIIPSHVLWG